MDQKRIGSFIAALRREQGLTQSQLAERLHISDRTISKWERGVGIPDASLMLPLCSELRISVNELLTGERIPSENIVSEGEEIVMELLAQYKRKMNRIVIAMVVLFYFAAALVAFVLCNRLVTGAYMDRGTEWIDGIERGMELAVSTDSIENLRQTIANSGGLFAYPLCVVMTDEQGNVIAETVTIESDEANIKCLDMARNGKPDPLGLIEYTITADSLQFARAFHFQGATYTVAAYSRTSQVMETLRSEEFLFAVMVLTIGAALFLILLAVSNKIVNRGILKI
ncbi:MAG: helix-turn-helix transcriptional regulator [Acetatifactor sp.]|nr:helix-turn-helix transcriptional regulator [Acetatifactor sp.]